MRVETKKIPIDRTKFLSFLSENHTMGIGELMRIIESGRFDHVSGDTHSMYRYEEQCPA
jgi:hypothetical protein